MPQLDSRMGGTLLEPPNRGGAHAMKRAGFLTSSCIGRVHNVASAKNTGEALRQNKAHRASGFNK
jgi:hypothetical protein